MEPFEDTCTLKVLESKSLKEEFDEVSKVRFRLFMLFSSYLFAEIRITMINYLIIKLRYVNPLS